MSERKEVLRGTLVMGSNDEGASVLAVVDPRTYHVVRVAEWAQSFLGWCRKQVSVRYYLANTALSEEDLQRAAVHTLLGAPRAEYALRYSEITGYLWTDETLQIGGHDLLAELRGHLGSFLHLEITIHE